MMKRRWLTVAGVAMAAWVSLSPAESLAGEMDLLLRGIVRNAASPEGAGPSWSKALSAGGLVPCILRSNDPAATAAAILRAGGSSKLAAGGILTARIPPEAVAAIAARGEVEAAEAAPPLANKMDTARTASDVVSVQDGSALGTSYRGLNVVVGVVDDALDYGNADFTALNGITRAQYVRQSDGETVLECTKRSIASGECAIADGGQGTFHGTHVTGIAAGSNETYTGVAPEADIMFVFLDADDADSGGTFGSALLEGATVIFEKADAIDKAAVINSSLGTSLGAHDGTSLLEQGLSTLSSAKGGRIIVNAAGNEQVVPAAFDAPERDYIGGLHARVSAVSGASTGWRMMVLSGRSAASAFTGGTLVDVWLDAGQGGACSVAAFSYTGGRASEDFSFPGALATSSAAISTGDVVFSADTPSPVTSDGAGARASIEVASADPRNNKPHATILFTPTSGSGSTLQDAWFDVVIRSNGTAACSGHMWIYTDYTSVHDFLKGISGTAVAGSGSYTLADGDSLFTMTIPATATGVIAAGSFMPPKPVGAATSTWTGDNGVTYDQSDLSAPGGTGSVTNDLSGFSSLGPTADGRTKPDIVAPGEPIISTKAADYSASSSITVGGSHVKEAGTSMASPHVAGIVALLLERNNTLTVDQVRAALAVGTSTGGMISKSADPANSYGAGKVDAAAVLGSVSPDTSAYHGTGDLESPGDGGCALTPSAGQAAAAFAVACMAAMGIAWLARRRSRLFTS